MNFNNYMVLLKNYDYTFIRTNADKDTTRKILTKYLRNRTVDKDLIDCFNPFGYKAQYLKDTNLYLYDIISSNNYSVLDLSYVKS